MHIISFDRKCNKTVEDKKPAKKRRIGYVGGSSDEDEGGDRDPIQSKNNFLLSFLFENRIEIPV